MTLFSLNHYNMITLISQIWWLTPQMLWSQQSCSKVGPLRHLRKEWIC